MKQRKQSQNGGVIQITCQVIFSFLWFVFMFLQFHFFLSLWICLSSSIISFCFIISTDQKVSSFLSWSWVPFLSLLSLTIHLRKDAIKKRTRRISKWNFNLNQLKIIIEKMKEKRIVKEKEGGVNDNLSGYFILLFLLYSFSVHCRYFSHISFSWLFSLDVLFWFVDFWDWVV